MLGLSNGVKELWILEFATFNLKFGRNVARKPRAVRGVKGHNIKMKLPCREALRHAQGRELCRTAPPCLSRPDGMPACREAGAGSFTFEILLSPILSVGSILSA
jgi:hypothetical protein